MYGDGVAEDTERTAFRKAEKKYKLYYDQSSRKYSPFLSVIKHMHDSFLIAIHAHKFENYRCQKEEAQTGRLIRSCRFQVNLGFFPENRQNP